MSAVTLIAAQAAAGAGNSVPVRVITRKRTFQVTITGIASVSVEGSNDGTNFVPLQANILSSVGYEDDAPWNFVRANVNTYTSGTVTVVMGEQA